MYIHIIILLNLIKIAVHCRFLVILLSLIHIVVCPCVVILLSVESRSFILLASASQVDLFSLVAWAVSLCLALETHLCTSCCTSFLSSHVMASKLLLHGGHSLQCCMFDLIPKDLWDILAYTRLLVSVMVVVGVVIFAGSSTSFVGFTILIIIFAS